MRKYVFRTRGFLFILFYREHIYTRAKENVFPDDGGDYKSCAKAHHFNYNDRQAENVNFLDSSSSTRAAISKATKHVEISESFSSLSTSPCQSRSFPSHNTK